MLNIVNTIDLDTSDKKFEVIHLEKGVYEIILDGYREFMEVLELDLHAKRLTVRYKHSTYEMEFENDLDIVLGNMGIKRTTESTNKDIKAPMPGKVIDIVVKEGDKVEKGDVILILEAMKMENVLKAASDCSIKKVHVVSSDNVEKNQLLVELEH